MPLPAAAGAFRTLLPMASFWPTNDHWSVEIPLDTPHPRLDVLKETGVRAARTDAVRRTRPRSTSRSSTWIGRAAVTRTSPRSPPTDGELDCRGFWNKGDEPDKDALWTSNAELVPDAARLRRPASAPTSAGCASSSSSRRTARRRSAPSTATTTTASTPTTRAGWCARWVELTDNPDSYMLLMDNGPDGLPDPATERARAAAPRAPASSSTRSACGTSWSTTATAPRYALITSFESGPALERWIDSQLPVS